MYKQGDPCNVGGFIVPLEFLNGQTLEDLEKTLGLAHRRLDQGAVIVQLRTIPRVDELLYFGDTRTPEHHFEARRNKDMTHDQLSTAAYQYIRPTTRLVKVISVKGHDPQGTNDFNWPSGKGAMQYKLKQLKPGVVLAVITDYPKGKVSV